MDPASSIGQPARWWQQLRLRDVTLATIIVVLVVLGFALLLALRNVVVSIFLGLMLATALRPLMLLLRGGNVPRVLAASAAVLTLILGIVGFLLLIAPLLSEQIRALVQAFPSLYAELRQVVVRSPLRIVHQLGLQLPPVWPGTDASTTSTFAAWVGAWLPSIGHTLFVISSTFLFTYYWLLYQERSLHGILLLLAQERRAGIEAVWLRIEERIGAFMRGQALLALLTAILSLVGYWLVGVPYALLLGLLAGLLEFVPYLGPLLTTVLATTIGFNESPALGLSALVVGVLVQQVENLVLVPRIMAAAVGVSPVVTLLAFVGFAALFGPLGGFLAIPLAAVLQVLFATWLDRLASTAAMTATVAANLGRAAPDRLQYQAQELMSDLKAHLREQETQLPAAHHTTTEHLEAILIDLQAQLNQEAQQA